MQRKAVLLAVALLLVPAAISQTQVNTSGVVRITPHMALQGADPMNPAKPGGAPVRIYGTSMGTNTIISSIGVINYSSKTVTSLEYGWRIAAPAACADSTLPVRWETASVTVNIASGNESKIDTPESLSRNGAAPELAEQARATNTQVVLVTIGIVRVTFADGSTWVDQEAVDRDTFDDNRADKKEGCQLRTAALSGK
jgi:hypothetical protein